MGGFRFNSDESIRTFLMATQMASNQHSENQEAKLKMMNLDLQLAQQETARQVEAAKAKADLARVNHEIEASRVSLGLKAKEEQRLTKDAESEAEYRKGVLENQTRETDSLIRERDRSYGLQQIELQLRARESQANIMRAWSDQRVQLFNAQLAADEAFSRRVQTAATAAESARNALGTAWATHDVENEKLSAVRPLASTTVATPLVTQDEQGNTITQGVGALRAPFLAVYNATGGDQAHGGTEKWVSGVTNKMLAEARTLSIDQATGEVNVTSDQFQGQVWNVVVGRQVTEDVAMAALNTKGEKFQALRDAAAILVGAPGEHQPIEIERARQVVNAHALYYPKSGELKFAVPGKKADGGGVGVTDLVAPLAAVKLATGGYSREDAAAGGGLDQMIRAAQATGAAEAYNYIRQDTRVRSAERYIEGARQRSVAADVTLNTVMQAGSDLRGGDLAGLREYTLDPSLDPRDFSAQEYIEAIDRITSGLVARNRR